MSTLRKCWLAAALLSVLAACSSTGGAPAAGDDAALVKVKLIAFNDLHGNLEPPGLAISAPDGAGGSVMVPAGGAAYLASAIATLKARNPNHAVVSAGDMIGASPLVSALFLDEPTIEAVNAMKIDFTAVGNHEFDKGRAELLRMQNGGCAKNTQLQPCRANGEFAGANFGFLAANVLAEGRTILPAAAVKRFPQKDGNSVAIGFIGMTLQATPTMVSPSGVAGLRFADEAETANALIGELKRQGADAIVLLIHEGARTQVGYNDKRCSGLAGDLLPILDRLSPQIDVVVSGHTHRAYICNRGPFLLTSAGQYGSLLTDIDLSIDTRTRKVVAKQADNVIVQGEAIERGTQRVPLTEHYPRFPQDPEVAALIANYRQLAAPLAQRVVGRLSRGATRESTASRENALGNLIADAQLAATRSPENGGAQLAFMNPGGVRADLQPAADGSVSYGQLFSTQPFGNHLVVKTFSGAQLKALLEQQFASGSNTPQAPRVLHVSQGFSYAYDLSKPAGARISAMALDGRPIADESRLRVTTNSFLADGGDNFSIFRQGSRPLGGGQDLDALEAYIRAHSPLAPPGTGRIRNLTPASSELSK